MSSSSRLRYSRHRTQIPTPEFPKSIQRMGWGGEADPIELAFAFGDLGLLDVRVQEEVAEERLSLPRACAFELDPNIHTTGVRERGVETLKMVRRCDGTRKRPTAAATPSSALRRPERESVFTSDRVSYFLLFFFLPISSLSSSSSSYPCCRTTKSSSSYHQEHRLRTRRAKLSE